MLDNVFEISRPESNPKFSSPGIRAMSGRNKARENKNYAEAGDTLSNWPSGNPKCALSIFRPAKGRACPRCGGTGNRTWGGGVNQSESSPTFWAANVGLGHRRFPDTRTPCLRRADKDAAALRQRKYSARLQGTCHRRRARVR